MHMVVSFFISLFFVSLRSATPWIQHRSDKCLRSLFVCRRSSIVTLLTRSESSITLELSMTIRYEIRVKENQNDREIYEKTQIFLRIYFIKNYSNCPKCTVRRTTPEACLQELLRSIGMKIISTKSINIWW